MGGVWGAVKGFLGGDGEGVLKTLADTVEDYFPPSMSDKEKADMKLALTKIEGENQIKLLELAKEQDDLFNQRIKDLEGTATDLKSVPIVGPIMLLARGSQRPIWGFATMFFDYQVFSSQWNIMADDQLKAVVMAINVLVLGFLFGERALKNVMPLIAAYFGKDVK